MRPEIALRSLACYLVVMGCHAAETQDSVFLRILYEGTTASYKDVLFTEELFLQFHLCLCRDATKTCMATFNTTNAFVQRIGNTTQTASNASNSSLFACTISPQLNDTLQCNRLHECNTTGHSTSYDLPNFGPCSFSCVGFAWTNSTEYFAPTGLIQRKQCSDHCSISPGTPAASTHRTSKKTTTISLTTAVTESINTKGMTTDTSRTKSMTSETSSHNKVAFIIGPVVGIMLAILIAAVIVFIIVRRRRQSSKSSSANDNGSSTIEAANNTASGELPCHFGSNPVVVPKKSHGCKNTTKKNKYSAMLSNTNTAPTLQCTKGVSNDSSGTDKDCSITKESREIDKNLTEPDGQLDMKSLRIPDEFGYAQLQQTRKNPLTADIQDKLNSESALRKTAMDNRLQQNNMFENSGPNMAVGDNQVNSCSYSDYVTVDTDENVSHGQVKLGGSTDDHSTASQIGKESADIDDGYSGIDLNKNKNKIPTDAENEYSKSINPYEDVTLEEKKDLKDTRQGGVTDNIYNVAEDRGYSPSPDKVINVGASSSGENDMLNQQLQREKLSSKYDIPEYATVNKRQTANSPYFGTTPETQKCAEFTTSNTNEEEPWANAAPVYAAINKNRKATEEKDTI